MIGEPFTRAWYALGIPIFAISVWTGVEQLEKPFRLFVPSRHFLPHPVLVLRVSKLCKPPPHLLRINQGREMPRRIFRGFDVVQERIASILLEHITKTLNDPVLPYETERSSLKLEDLGIQRG